MTAVDLEQVTVDGLPMADGYGIQIGYEKPGIDACLSVLVPKVFVDSPRLVAWVTKRQINGSYEKHRELERGCRVIGRYQDQTVEFCDGEATVTYPQRIVHAPGHIPMVRWPRARPPQT